jgi:hypothetical protein
MVGMPWFNQSFLTSSNRALWRNCLLPLLYLRHQHGEGMERTAKDPLHLKIRLSMSVKVWGWIEGSIACVKPQHDALLYAEE